MDAYRVRVVQTTKDDEGKSHNATFVEYVLTLLQVSYILKRLHPETPEDRNFRHVSSVTVESIWIQD